jgi:phosphatidylinositol 4-kinase
MLPGWKLFGFIAKNNTDIRQEAFVMQLIRIFQDFFDEDRVPVRLYPYRIQTTSKTTGLAEYPEYAVSIDAIKQSPNYQGSLLGYFESSFGPQSSETFRAAVTNFVKSMAGYSVVTYLLSIKDRHNGNIMIDNDGYMIHTDCEFAFGYSSNKSASLEKAPFKLTQEIVDVMLGMDSVHYAEYKKLCIQAFISSRKHADKLCKLFEIMSYNSNYTAFKRNPNWISDFRTKLALNMQDTEIWQEIDRLVSKSYNHSGTLSYDRYQRATNGIAY